MKPATPPSTPVRTFTVHFLALHEYDYEIEATDEDAAQALAQARYYQLSIEERAADLAIDYVEVEEVRS